MLLGDDEIGAFGFRKLLKRGWKVGRWANPLTAGATLAQKGVRAAARRRGGRKGGLRGAYPELEEIADADDISDGEELGFIKQLVKSVGGAAKFGAQFVPGPAGAALRIAGGAASKAGGGGKAAPPPPACTLLQKVKRAFGGKPPCV